MRAFYNEIDSYCCDWLSNLMDAGHITPGVISNKSIEDITPDELSGFGRAHFFAGLAGWDLAFRLGGLAHDDGRVIWSGSAPCQPFSAAGKGGGFADERHLWPAFDWLIGQCRPDIVLGEQVEGPAGRAWLDLVATDVEGHGYAFGTAVFPAAGVGAPQIRHRTYWMASTAVAGREWWRASQASDGRVSPRLELERLRDVSRLARADEGQCGRLSGGEGRECDGQAGGWQQGDGGAPGDRAVGGLGDAECVGRRDWRQRQGDEIAILLTENCKPDGELSGPVNGFWRTSDWLYCRDDRWRPVSAFPQPLASGVAESLGRVRPEVIAKIEEEISASGMDDEIRRDQILRDLQISLGKEAQLCWEANRIPGLCEAPFLLAFVRQLQEQGWRVEECVSLPRTQGEAERVRVLRDDDGSSGSPHRRELEEQRPDQPSDALHFLSSLLARHAHSAWDDAYTAYAEAKFPLAHGARNRVGRLRAYGNAICVPQAVAFVEAVTEALLSKQLVESV